jgi:hypothetical protein
MPRIVKIPHQDETRDRERGKSEKNKNTGGFKERSFSIDFKSTHLISVSGDSGSFSETVSDK